MAQTNKIVPLRKVLLNQTGKQRSEKYINGIDFSKNETVFLKTGDLYQKALDNLLDGNTETAINYIIFALDVDRNDKLILHLAKLMILSLSQFLAENNIETYSKKYGANLEETNSKIRKKIRLLGDIINKNTLELEKIDEFIESSSRSFFFRLFKLKNFRRQRDRIMQGIYDNRAEIESFKKDLNNVEKMLKVDEYVNILSLVLEVCVFPTRFEWILSK